MVAFAVPPGHHARRPRWPVLAMHLAHGQLRDAARCAPPARDHHRAVGVLVEPVHDARAAASPAPGRGAAAVHQRAGGIARAWCTTRAGRFVDDEYRRVLVQDVERDVLGHGVGLHVLDHRQRHRLAAAHRSRGRAGCVEHGRRRTLIHPPAADASTAVTARRTASKRRSGGVRGDGRRAARLRWQDRSCGNRSGTAPWPARAGCYYPRSVPTCPVHDPDRLGFALRCCLLAVLLSGRHRLQPDEGMFRTRTRTRACRSSSCTPRPRSLRGGNYDSDRSPACLVAQYPCSYTEQALMETAYAEFKSRQQRGRDLDHRPLLAHLSEPPQQRST